MFARQERCLLPAEECGPLQLCNVCGQAGRLGHGRAAFRPDATPGSSPEHRQLQSAHLASAATFPPGWPAASFLAAIFNLASTDQEHSARPETNAGHAQRGHFRLCPSAGLDFSAGAAPGAWPARTRTRPTQLRLCHRCLRGSVAKGLDAPAAPASASLDSGCCRLHFRDPSLWQLPGVAAGLGALGTDGRTRDVQRGHLRRGHQRM